MSASRSPSASRSASVGSFPLRSSVSAGMGAKAGALAVPVFCEEGLAEDGSLHERVEVAVAVDVSEAGRRSLGRVRVSGVDVEVAEAEGVASVREAGRARTAGVLEQQGDRELAAVDAGAEGVEVAVPIEIDERGVADEDEAQRRGVGSRESRCRRCARVLDPLAITEQRWREEAVEVAVAVEVGELVRERGQTEGIRDGRGEGRRARATRVLEEGGGRVREAEPVEVAVAVEVRELVHDRGQAERIRHRRREGRGRGRPGVQEVGRLRQRARDQQIEVAVGVEVGETRDREGALRDETEGIRLRRGEGG